MSKEVVKFSNIDERIACFDETREMLHELKNHYIYKNMNKNGVNDDLASFAKGMTYDRRLKVVHNKIVDFCEKATGISHELYTKTLNPKLGAFDNAEFRKAYFSVIARTIDESTSKYTIEQAMPFAEVEPVGYGDSALFNIGSKNVFEISRIANGVSRTHLQRLYDSSITIRPVRRMGTFSISLYKIAAGREDIGAFVAKMNQSILAAMHQEVINLMFDTANSNPVNAIEVTYSTRADFTDLVQDLEALNNSRDIQAYGTKTALGSILPDVNLQQNLGLEYMEKGYIGTLFGTPSYQLFQARNVNTNATDVVPNDKVLLVPSSGDRPVKIAIEGTSTVTELNRSGETADDQYVFTLAHAWEMKIASQTHFGIVSV